MSGKENITLRMPALGYGINLLAAALNGAIGLVCLLLVIPLYLQAGGFAIVPMAGAVCCLSICLLIVKNMCHSVEFARDKLIIKRIACWKKEIPLNRIKLFTESVHMVKNGLVHTLGISPYTVEELTHLQEAKLQKGILTRQELPFMKRKAGWQEEFAKTFVLRRVKWFPICGQEIFFLPWSPEVVAMLGMLYPEIPRLEMEESDISQRAYEKDKDPCCFRRNRAEGKDGYIFFLLMIPLLIMPFLFSLMAQSLLLSLITLAPLVLLVLLLYPVVKSEQDTICLLPEKLQILRDKKVYTELPAEKITTIIVGKADGNNMLFPYIAVTALDVEQLASREVKWRSKTKNGQRQCQALYVLPDWQSLLAESYCRRFADLSMKRNDALIFMAYREQREETLRRLYPSAKWIIDD